MLTRTTRSSNFEQATREEMIRLQRRIAKLEEQRTETCTSSSAPLGEPNNHHHETQSYLPPPFLESDPESGVTAAASLEL